MNNNNNNNNNNNQYKVKDVLEHILFNMHYHLILILNISVFMRNIFLVLMKIFIIKKTVKIHCLFM